MTQTTNYQLPKWEKSDRIRMADFNADNAKIDAALASFNSRLYITTYTGTGASTLTLTFPRKPLIFLTTSSEATALSVGLYGCARVPALCASIGGSLTPTWSGSSVRLALDSDEIFYVNDRNVVYTLFAVLDGES